MPTFSRQGSEATTAKTTSTKSKPWREVNDEIAARMMAASSDSPPLIPRRDYDDGDQFAAKKMAMINRPKPPASYNTTSECSSTDDCKNLIENNRRHPFEYQQQLTLYRGQHFEPGIDSVPMPMPYDVNAFPCHMMSPPPGPTFMGPMDFQHDPAYMGGAPPFQGDFMPPLPMMPMVPAFMPPMMHSHDFESITLLKQKKLKKKKMKRRSHSMEALPPPMFGMPPPPHFFGPSIGPPVPGPWGCPQMPPFITSNGPLALEYPGANRDCEQEACRYQLPQAPIAPGGGPFAMPPPPQVAMNPCVDDVPPTTNYHQLGEAFDQKIAHSADGDIFKDKESYKKEKIDYASCCKNFSQVLWIIIGIVLVGLILGLVLGLTLV
uniref:Uncharacterized protein n=1 Tax=Romanomermis culicivorax TaxID=13658 RepID=A0A915J9V7_ROMCU